MLEKHKNIRRISIILWVSVNIGILLLSLLPADRIVMGDANINDKLAHGFAYMVLGALTYLFLSFIHTSVSDKTFRKLMISIAYCVLLGGLIEVLQPLSGRAMEFLDLVADLIGTLTGVLIMKLLVDKYHNWFKNRKTT